MKNLFSLLIVFLSLNLVAQENEGVNLIEDLTFEEVLELAKKENKPIFIDCYVPGCGACVMLKKNVFPQKEAGDFYNKTFICAGFDLSTEKGKEVAKYDIKAYPTLLFLNQEGELIYKQIGASRNAADLLALGEEALKPDNKYLRLTSKMGQGSPEDLTAEDISLLLDLNETKDAQFWVKQYMEVVDDTAKYTRETLALLANNTRRFTDESFKIILDNEEEFRNNLEDSSMVDQIIRSIYARGFMEYERLIKQEHPQLENAKTQAAYWNCFREYMMDNENKSKWTEFVAAFDGMFESGIVRNMQINNTAWTVYENYKKHDNDTTALRLAEKWCEKAVEEERNMYIVDTYAAIVFELGDINKAIELQEEAVKLIQASNDPGYIEAYENRLKKFKEAL